MAYPVGTITGYGIDPENGYTEPALNTYYLDPTNGDDVTGDGSTSLPWASLSKIFTVMSSGDSIILRTGNYGNFSLTNSTVLTDWITFKADVGHTPVIDTLTISNTVLQDTYLRFDNITFTFNITGNIFNITNVRYLELRGSTIYNPDNKYDTGYGVRIFNSNNVLIYNNHIYSVSRIVGCTDSNNVTISKNHGHKHVSTGVYYGAGNGNFIVEKNNIYDSNFDTWDVDPASPYDPNDIGTWPHSGGMSLRSSNIWIRGNIFHNTGSTSGIMTYGGVIPSFDNITIENNLFYDIHNTPLRFYLLGLNVTIKNNTVIGKERNDVTSCPLKLYSAMTVHTLASGTDGSTFSVLNNIMFGTVFLPDLCITQNNMFWAQSWLSDGFTFVTTSNDVNTVISTIGGSDPSCPYTDFTSSFFAGIDSLSNFNERHGEVRDFTLDPNSSAINFADTATQSAVSLGALDINGFIQGTPVRDTSNYSIGAFEYYVDITNPIISTPTAVKTGSLTATGTVDTDEAHGTLYFLASTNATETAATIKGGGSQVIAELGTQNILFTGLTASTTYYAHYVQDDASLNESNVVSSTSFTTDAPDVTAPIISTPTAVKTGDTTANGSVSTDESNGILYFLASTNSTETAATIKGGGSQTVTVTGIQQVKITGLTASTTYYIHYVHDDASLNESNVVSSASFTTDVTDVTAPILSSVSGVATGTTTAIGTVNTDEVGGILYYLISSNATETAATIKAASSIPVDASGVQQTSFINLTKGTTYYVHYVHDDASLNESNVISSASFITDFLAVGSLFDPAHVVVQNATSLVSFDVIGSSGEPFDDSTSTYWTPDTTNDSVAYAKQTINDVLQLARQDIDESGICYQAPLTGLDPDIVPFWFMVSYSVLATPSAAWRSVLQVANIPRSAGAVFNINSEDTTNMRTWCAGASRFTAIPINGTNQHFVIYKYDGVDAHSFYDSQYGSWRTDTAAHTNGSASTGFWLGTGYNGDLPASFEYFVGAIGYAPSQTILDSLVIDPYQVFLTDIFSGIYGKGGTRSGSPVYGQGDSDSGSKFYGKFGTSSGSKIY